MLYLKLKSAQTFELIKKNPANVQKLEEDHELSQAFCNLFTAYKSECMCNDEEASVLDYELEEFLVLDMHYKVLLYMSKVHLNDLMSKILDTVLKKRENFSIETFIWISKIKITSYT